MWARRTLFADFNGDGRQDVFIADTGYDALPFSGYPNTLILSAPGGKLVDASANLPRDPDFTHSGAVGDVDRNGTVDIFAGNLSSGCGGCAQVPPEVLLNDGTGHFQVLAGALPADVAAPFSPHYDASTLADLTGDGALDLVLLGSPSANSRVLVNDGSGHFSDLPNAIPAKPWAPDAEGLAVTAADLNADGHLDLLLAYTKNQPFYVGRWIQVLINDGNGTFRDETSTRLPQTDNSGVWPYAVQVADLNGDHLPDIAVSLFSFPASAPPFYLNRGDGTFAPIDSRAFVATPPPMFALLDANHDGRLDVFGSTSAGAGPEQHFLIEQLGRPRAVTGARASHGTFRDRVRISWHSVPQRARYEVWRSLHGKRKSIGASSSTRFDDRRARKGVRYRYFVRAMNRVGAGPFSAGASSRTGRGASRCSASGGRVETRSRRPRAARSRACGRSRSKVRCRPTGRRGSTGACAPRGRRRSPDGSPRLRCRGPGTRVPPTSRSPRRSCRASPSPSSRPSRRARRSVRRRS